jgi:hypothetical protein
MAASVEVDEGNGAVEATTHGVTNSNYGTSDTPNLNATANPITPASNSYEKWHRWHVTAMGGAVSVRAFRFYSSAPAASVVHGFNGSTVQGTYDGANHKQTAYAQPATSATRTPETVPTSPPATGNIGFGGSLTGEITAVNRTDYLLTQIRPAGGATAGTVQTNAYRYDEIA